MQPLSCQKPLPVGVENCDPVIQNFLNDAIPWTRRLLPESSGPSSGYDRYLESWLKTLPALQTLFPSCFAPSQVLMISPPLNKCPGQDGSNWRKQTWRYLGAKSCAVLYSRLKPALELKPVKSQCGTCSNLNNPQETNRHGEGGKYHGDPQDLCYICVPIWGGFQLHLQQVQTYCLLEGKVEGLEASLATYWDLSGKIRNFWARQKDFQNNSNNNTGRKTIEKSRAFGKDTWRPVTQRTTWIKRCSLSVTKQNHF